ncbi:MAG: TIGR02453 family protein [Actinomycetota bacterium]|nr:TIGR02453 family protein [Actinomycetota bacterium]
MTQTYFTPAVFKFLRELEENNNRPWFEANKDRYVSTIREPAKEFIADFEPRLTNISDHFLADTRTNGGSLMRPYRDTRFGSDKTPYKTNVGIQFRHEMGKDVHAPGFYLHFEPGSCWAGVGLWNPEAKVAKKIRDRIYGETSEWKKAAKSKTFTDTWEISYEDAEMLKRVPKEYGDGFAYPDDVRKKSFTAGAKLTQKTVTSSSFDAEIAKLYSRAAGYTEFLCKAIGLPF